MEKRSSPLKPLDEPKQSVSTTNLNAKESKSIEEFSQQRSSLEVLLSSIDLKMAKAKCSLHEEEVE